MFHRPDRARRIGMLTALLLAVGTTGAIAVEPVSIDLLENSADRIAAEYHFTGFAADPVKVDGREYWRITLSGESQTMEAGLPEVPKACRSYVIPDNAAMAVNVLEVDYQDVPNVDLIPSRGSISRTVNPDDVPYTFGHAYSEDAFYPAQVAELREPYIMRDHRGMVLTVNPVQYNPVTRTLRLYSRVRVEMLSAGPGEVNILTARPKGRELSLAFHELYQHHFVNYRAPQRYAPLDETGDMLIIAHDAWLSNVQPLADHKNARGINTTVVGVGTIGNNSTAIKNYIQGVYDSSDLAFVLLVGDGSQVDTPSASGGSSDPSYAKLAGSDNYPDIMVGRFSAETAAHVDTQVNRTIAYETMPATAQDWFWRATGIASSQGAGIGDEGQADYVHMDEIRQWLLGYGYTVVDQIYATNGGTAAMVSAAVNNGRGLINYTGHGSTTDWSTTGFSNTHINALNNNNMWPFVFSVACVNGQFDGYTCFGEAWLRASNASGPTGAIAAYMSSINQEWAPPMEGQDEFNLLFTAEAYAAFGTYCYAGSCSMMDDYGSTSGTDGVNMYNTWHIFGDPSVKITMTCVDAGTIALDRERYACDDSLTVLVNDCGLNTDDGVVDSVTVTVASDSEPVGETVVLTETDPASAQFQGSIGISVAGGTGVLTVAEGDTITATYNDADDGTGSPAVAQDTAVVDCTPPQITNVQTPTVEPRNAVVTFDSNEPAKGTVHYGASCGALTETATGSSYGTAVEVGVAGLQDNSTYYYAVEAEDLAGNTTSDDNGGYCYSFTTPEVPDFFTELFESDNDLDNISLIFTPNGSNDFYAACAEEIDALPTDPTGGTTVSLSDDSYSQVTLTGGATVSLYGASYSTFYVGSNGYLTFDHGDSAREESFEAHFGTPRVSALYDDLNPPSGSVTRKQLADRVAITFLDVPEWNVTGSSNTFQIEMFFDGTITISYLSVSASDGLAGLSEGEGVDPDFLENDLSAFGPCGPKPPHASNGTDTTAIDTPVLCPLSATDDGLPDPPAQLEFIIDSLPDHGALYDPNAAEILSVPYTLTANGNQVRYEPDPGYEGPDSFTFLANDGGEAPDGGDSNVATVSVTVGGSAWTPVAYNVADSTQVNVPVTVELLANDPNGDPLTYTIESLPPTGHLSDPDVPGVAIEAVPYDLPGRFVNYHPPCGAMYPEVFNFTVSDATATSNEAEVTVSITTDDPRLVYDFPMDVDPGWSIEGDWEFGPATAGGSHNGDPGAAHTGTNVFGYNLGGDYLNFMPQYYLTTGALDCSVLNDVELRFWRWLGVESYPGYDVDHATVEISSDGVNFDIIWENTGESIDDDSWVEMVFDLSAYADGQETVYLRWGMGPTDNGVTYPGWNLDDVELWGIADPDVADFNADAFVDLEDAELFEQCLGGPEQGLALPCLCVDLDADGDVDLADFAEFQTAYAD